MKKKCEGSITVEAALLFPIVIFVIVTIIFFSFYLCDVVCVRAVIEKYCVTEENSNKTEEMIISDLNESLKNQTLVTQIKNINVMKKKGKTYIEVFLNFHMGYWNINKNDKVKVTMHGENTRQFIVRQKVVIDTANKLREEN